MYLERSADQLIPAAQGGLVNRRAERVAFDLLVRYAWRGQRATAMLKDLTRFGARIEGVDGLRKGDGLILLLPDLQPIDADVAWASGRSAGLSLADAIPARAYHDLVSHFATGRLQPGTIGGGFLTRAA